MPLKGESGGVGRGERLQVGDQVGEAQRFIVQGTDDVVGGLTDAVLDGFEFTAQEVIWGGIGASSRGWIASNLSKLAVTLPN
ncbi:MAG TPA: hypothetical protein VF328_27120 [Mycobacterium sp.]